MNKTPHKTCFFLDINLDNTEDVFVTNILTCILNVVFSLITCVGNFVILHAIRKAQHLHSPSFVLLCCLAFSDLLVGAMCQPSFVAYKIAELLNNFGPYCTLKMFHEVIGYITSGVSCLTLAAVCIDRLLSLTLHLRYNMIVTVPRVFLTAFVLWVFVIILVMLRFWMSNEWILLLGSILLLTFFVTALDTFKIFQIVRRHRRRINDQNLAALSFTTHTRTVNVIKCKKSAVTVLYVYGLFIIFYLPLCVMMPVYSIYGNTTAVKIASNFATTAVYINSSLNPFVYCWRIREIRRAVKNVLRMRE